MVAICLMRGVNVGGTGKLPMAEWRALCESLGCQDVRTYIQSGNAVFRVAPRQMGTLAARMEAAIEREFGFRRPALLRTLEEWREVVGRNPLAGRAGVDPAKLVVSFHAAPVTAAVRQAVDALGDGFPEEVVTLEREGFLYFPEGQGRSKLPLAKMEKALGVASTARNWNTVLQLLAMAEELEKT